MHYRFARIPRLVFMETALCALSCAFLPTHPAVAETEELEAVFSPLEIFNREERYQINFNNVLMPEYLRFVSKISGVNFVFDDNELQFAVTIVSEESISLKNILSTLIQVLRIHDLMLLEQDNNLLITKNLNVKQISSLVLDSGDSKSPIVTRVFRLKNASPTALSAIIRPMMSSGALLEVLESSRQLIATDVATNVDKISELLISLDAPSSLLDVKTYSAKYLSSKDLAAVASQITLPLAEGNPLLLVPQAESNIIYIVSTPYLIERTLVILEDLDSPSKVREGAMSGSTLFLYKTQMRSPLEIHRSLTEIAKELKKGGSGMVRLMEMLSNAQVIQESGSILFTGDVESIAKLKEILVSIDTALGQASSGFILYKPQFQSGDALVRAMREVGANLKKGGLMDMALLDSIEQSQWMPLTSSLILTGDQTSLLKIQEILKLLDTREGISSEELLTGVPGITPTKVSGIQQIGKLTFLLYQPKFVSANQLMSSLRNLSQDLEQNQLLDKNFSDAIKNMKWIPENNSLLFTGTVSSLEKIQSLLERFDVGDATALQRQAVESFILYSPQFQTGPELIAILADFMQNLKNAGVSDQNLFEAIQNIKWIEKTANLLISGDNESIKKVQDLLSKFDISKGTEAVGSIVDMNFMVFKLQYHKGEEIQKALKQVGIELAKSGQATNQNLVSAINSMQWITITNSLISTGDPDTLQRLRELIKNLDVPLRQVFIEVLVVTTSLSNAQNFGLQWGSQAQYLNRMALAGGNSPTTILPPQPTGRTSTTAPNVFNLPLINATRTPLGSDVPLSTGFDLGVIGDIILNKGRTFISMGALVNALQTDTDTTVVMNPKIITQDNRTSTIFVGSNIPFVGSLVTTTSASQTQTTSIEYRDIGINLSITPNIGNGNVVTLDISNDISQLSQGQPTVTAGSVSGITTTHTSMNTRVSIPDRHFLALSGMIQDTKTHFKTGIPCLGSIPVIGLAFSENDRLDNKSNIIIFVRPFIIDTFEEYDRITQHQECLFKEQASLPVLKEEFDSGIEMLKCPD